MRLTLVSRIFDNQHLLDATEIFRKLNVHKKVSQLPTRCGQSVFARTGGIRCTDTESRNHSSSSASI